MAHTRNPLHYTITPFFPRVREAAGAGDWLTQGPCGAGISRLAGLGRPAVNRPARNPAVKRPIIARRALLLRGPPHRHADQGFEPVRRRDRRIVSVELVRRARFLETALAYPGPKRCPCSVGLLVRPRVQAFGVEAAGKFSRFYPANPPSPPPRRGLEKEPGPDFAVWPLPVIRGDERSVSGSDSQLLQVV